MQGLPQSAVSEIAIMANTSKENVARVLFSKSGVPLETQKRIIAAIQDWTRRNGNADTQPIHRVNPDLLEPNDEEDAAKHR
jgi:hypothetical protein